MVAAVGETVCGDSYDVHLFEELQESVFILSSRTVVVVVYESRCSV